MSVVAPGPENTAFAAPVNSIVAPPFPPFVLNSRVPSFVRFPPTWSLWFVVVPAGFDWNVPPLAIVTSPATVRVLAGIVAGY